MLQLGELNQYEFISFSEGVKFSLNLNQLTWDFYVLYRAYDRAAVKFRGIDADINFTVSDYEEDMKQVEYVYTVVLCFKF